MKQGRNVTLMRIMLVAIIAIGAAGFISAGQKSPMYVVAKGLVQFRSDAQLELINASSGRLKGIINPADRTFAFSIDMNSFDGFNSPLQKEHFKENYIESERFPNATFAGRIIEEDDFLKEGTYTLRAKGKLSVHGVENERIIKADVEMKRGVLHVRSNFTVMLADHNIKIPRIVYEKLASEIKVEINADFVQQ